MMAEFDGQVDSRLLRLLSKAKPVRWGYFHHQYTSTYYHDRVAILGDSAHASLPYQAAGAGQGLEDALILSNTLAEAVKGHRNHLPLQDRLRAALGGYDFVRRPRAQKQLEQSAELSLLLNFQHPDAGSDMGKILPRLQNGRFDWLWFHDLTADIETAVANMGEMLQAKV
jgi:salicylate hydroxylase